jgi:DNA-binding beta-propeller fold protein YncE
MTRLIVTMIMMLLPLQAFGAEEEIRFKHARSLYGDDKGVGMKNPEGVACGRDRLVVADTGNSRLLLYSLQGAEPKGGTEVLVPQVVYPIRLVMSSTGDLYAIDGRQRKVARLSSEGTFKNYVEITGLPLEGMVIPAGISLDGKDNLYLLDVANNRVLVFGDDGKFQRQILFPKDYGFINDLTVDARGTVFLLDSVNAVVFSNAKDPAAFAPLTGKMKDDMQFPANIIAGQQGVLFISDQNGGGIIAVRPDGTARRLFSMGWKEGTLRYPAQLCLDSGGDLFVADRDNSRIQVFIPLK